MNADEQTYSPEDVVTVEAFCKFCGIWPVTLRVRELFMLERFTCPQCQRPSENRIHVHDPNPS